MTITARVSTAALTLAVLGWPAGYSAARAQSPGHVAQVARQVQTQARSLRRDVYNRYRQTRAYPHLDRDLVEIERLAAHIHEEVQTGGVGDHLKADAGRLDRWYHHLLEVVDYLARTREADPSSVGELRRSVRTLGRTVHHLTADLGAGHGSHGHGHDHPH